MGFVTRCVLFTVGLGVELLISSRQEELRVKVGVGRQEIRVYGSGRIY